MKIVCIDKFDREAERLVAENIQSQREADIILKALQDNCYKDGPDWYKIAEDDYKLWRGMEELV